MDNGLVWSWHLKSWRIEYGLNPYCSGQWSRTSLNWAICANTRVLIFIVVDNGLVQYNLIVLVFILKVLILIVVDDGLVRDCCRLRKCERQS